MSPLALLVVELEVHRLVYPRCAVLWQQWAACLASPRMSLELDSPLRKLVSLLVALPLSQRRQLPQLFQQWRHPCLPRLCFLQLSPSLHPLLSRANRAEPW